ncbi:MAG: M67 family metallopeptidase [Melioribacter sp.]|uniref:M67 family metallopeptidase n=1 Tax=Rosettibacter primus TaxID=3111523 RepID=UPI00247C2CA4|nr:M67 family metallopeptidase [Melioribacter sp.]
MSDKILFQINKDLLEKIKEQGRKEAPIEACGYLAGNDNVAKEVIYMKNIDNSPEHFTFDPKEQFAALKYARSKGLDLIGVYHTHPATPARMSKEDIRLANDTNIVYLIYSLTEDVIRAFKVDKDKNVSEIEVVINVEFRTLNS